MLRRRCWAGYRARHTGLAAPGLYSQHLVDHETRGAETAPAQCSGTGRSAPKPAWHRAFLPCTRGAPLAPEMRSFQWPDGARRWERMGPAVGRQRAERFLNFCRSNLKGRMENSLGQSLVLHTGTARPRRPGLCLKTLSKVKWIQT